MPVLLKGEGKIQKSRQDAGATREKIQRQNSKAPAGGQRYVRKKANSKEPARRRRYGMARAALAEHRVWSGDAVRAGGIGEGKIQKSRRAKGLRSSRRNIGREGPELR